MPGDEHMQKTNENIMAVLEVLRSSYEDRNPARIGAVMDLFDEGEGIELIGIGASERGGAEWFSGKEDIREIILGDWELWGDVVIHTKDAHITVNGETAWISMTATLLKNESFDKALFDSADQMKMMLEGLDPNKDDPQDAILASSYFGLGRLLDAKKPVGEGWPLVITAVLVSRAGAWKIHSMHWSMPPEG